MNTATADQCVLFARACCKKWGLPPCTKLVIECEVGMPMKVYFATVLPAITNEDQSALLENVRDVAVGDKCQVVTVPHLSVVS